MMDLTKKYNERLILSEAVDVIRTTKDLSKHGHSTEYLDGVIHLTNYRLECSWRTGSSYEKYSLLLCHLGSCTMDKINNNQNNFEIRDNLTGSVLTFASHNRSMVIVHRILNKLIESDYFYEYWSVEQGPIDMKQPIIRIIDNSASRFAILDIFEDLIKRDEDLFFTVALTFVMLLTIVFSFLSFGVCVCAFLFLHIATFGFNIIFSQNSHVARSRFNKNNKVWRRLFNPYIKSFSQFKASFDRRFNWENPRYTLEVECFLLTTSLMFWFFDPAFVLTISLFGLSFAERWDPVGFGCIQDIIGNLFSI